MAVLTVDMEEYSTGRVTTWCLRQTAQGQAWFWFDHGAWVELGCLGTFERISQARSYLIETCKPYFCTRIRKTPPSAFIQKMSIAMEPELYWRFKSLAQMLNLPQNELWRQVFIAWSSPGEFRTLDRERILEAFEERRERLRLI